MNDGRERQGLARASDRARPWHHSVAVAAALAAALSLTACPDRDGPAENAGEKVDKAVDGMKDAVDPDGPAEKLGEKLDDATD